MASFTDEQLKEILSYVQKNNSKRFWEYDDHLSSQKVHRKGILMPAGTGLTWDGGETFNDTNLNAWTAWAPTITNLTLGSGTLAGYYKQLGKTVIARVELTWAADTSYGGAIYCSMPPVTAVTYLSQSPIGQTMIQDATGLLLEGVIKWRSTSAVNLYSYLVSGAYISTEVIDASHPFTWTTSDKLSFQFTYEAA